MCTDFPNLPFYGYLKLEHRMTGTPIPEAPYIELPESQLWNWTIIEKLLLLGVHHWGFPIILNSILPQPWQTLRDSFQRVKHPTCVRPNWECRKTIYKQHITYFIWAWTQAISI